jgi:putative holliday junction resolvase
MKYLGLDVGDRRIGIAFGDSELRMTTPVDVIIRATLERDVQAIAEFAKRYDVEHIVVGLPRNMDGTEGAQAESVIAFAKKIAQMISVPQIFWDERLSTVEATQRSHATGAHGKKARRNLDAIAAAVILQDFLDSQARPNSE